MNQQHTYYPMQQPSTGRVRNAWTSSVSGSTFCGICMREEVPVASGAECPSCGSRILRPFAVIEGGAPLRLSAWKKSNWQAAKIASAGPGAERGGNLLIMRTA